VTFASLAVAQASSANRAFIVASASVASISMSSFSMIAGGVSFGALASDHSLLVDPSAKGRHEP
jgi:hypothetical protein